MIDRRAVILLAIVVSAPLVAQGTIPKTPAETLVIVAAGPPHGVSGRYEMTVVAAEKTTVATYLNSTADYKASDNLTFRLRPIVANALAKRLGGSPETALIGKHIVVDGIAMQVPIVYGSGGRPRGLARIAVEVKIDRVAQIIAID